MFKRQNEIENKNKHKFNSYLGYNRDWWSYYSQYKNAIDELVNGIENNIPIDTISLPLLFMIRHSIEIGLKANILKLQKVNPEIKEISLGGTKSHSIEILYNKFEEHLILTIKNSEIRKTIIGEINGYLKKFKPLKNKLHNLDKGSFNFRYPVDTNGNYNFEWDEKENIADIINLYYKIQPFLLFTNRVLYEEGVFGFE
ncbi:hypothetical protein [Urechidicola croceus]|uniref:Uncharacterized protein n=1 Tax=Urechidicola croceus TaxID=1850246 RepID=A0A1D8P499_9FLAO|nr:hypothetical protein [Urechidicola croceus]AOW19387.1 hypothetical protein LPB138_01225 [Urechidicola croceus]